jgi:hypothetical protein
MYLARPKLKRHYLQPLEHYKLKTEGSTPTSSFKAWPQDFKIPSSYMKEAMTPSQQKLPEKPRLFRTSIASWEPSDSRRIFSDILDSLTPLTLKVSRWGFIMTFRQHQLFSHQLQQIKTDYIFHISKYTTQLKVSPVRWKSNRWSLTLT